MTSPNSPDFAALQRAFGTIIKPAQQPDEGGAEKTEKTHVPDANESDKREDKEKPTSE